jgi:hypothetical protein
VTNGRKGGHWLKASAEIVLYNQAHWWIIPASLLLYGAVTAVQLAPYQAQGSGYGDGSLLLLSNSILRYYTLNPIYLFIAANIGGYHRYEELILHRLGSRQRLWLGKVVVLVALTVGYLGAVVLSAEIASIPFISNRERGWSETILAYYGELAFAASKPQAVVWGSTVWFVFLSWLALGGVALVIAQTTGRPGGGFFTALALSWLWFIADIIDPTSGLFYIFDIRRPMLFFWYGEPMISFRAATVYWSVWYIVLAGVVFWHIDRAGRMISARLRAWGRGSWLIMQTSIGRSWLIVVTFALISALVDTQVRVGAEIDALHLVEARLAPIMSLGGPLLDYPLFSLIFLRWLLIFLIFLFITGETAVRSLWRQHVMLLSRLGGRTHWWFSNVTAVAGLSLLYLLIYLGVNWLIGREAVRVYDLPFYLLIFVLYWFTLTWLGCCQLLLLLLTRSRNQTLLIMGLFLAAVWLVGTNYPPLLPWLPVAQTAILAQLLHSGLVDGVGLLLWGMFLLTVCTLAGMVAIQRHEFTGFLKHN